MKTIQIEDDLYQYIASKTENIGESASAILRRLLLEQQDDNAPTVKLQPLSEATQENSAPLETAPEEVVTQSEKPVSSSVFNVLNKEEVATQKGAVGRFLFILSALHRCHPNDFSQVLEVKGRERNYFADNEDDLVASGSSVKPKAIPESKFWVVTNNNTPRKKLIITEAALALGYDQQQAEKLREFI